MTRNPGRFLSTCIVTLCVALMVAFAQTSAASVVNGVQHAAGAAMGHSHAGHGAAAFDHGHHDEADAPDLDVASDDGVDQDARMAHHHHSDSPPAGLAADVDMIATIPVGGERLLFGPDDIVRATGSPGPERPPRQIASRV